MPIATPTTLITCPGCGQTLPGAAARCQFCGADVTKVARPVVQQTRRVAGPEKWIVTLYYIGAAWWILQGVRSIAAGLGFLSDILAGPASALASFAAIPIVIGAILVILGIGLVVKWDLARGVVNILCWINIIGGLAGFIGLFSAALVFGPLVILGIVLNVIDLVVAGGMIWLISETEQWR